MSILVILESPAKCKKIGDILKSLGHDVVVKASYGHVSDLDKKKLSIDVSNQFKPNYIINRDNLQQVFVLIDCKVGIKDKDIDIFDTICESNKKFSIILTKIDKCAVNFAESQKESLLSLMKNYKPHFNKIFSTSSSKNIGITDIQKDVFNLSKII